MARFRLTAAHYIRVPGTQYKYEETSRESGEKTEAVFDVPRFLDPNNPRDCRSGGDCIVCFGSGAQKGDWPVLGDPTPDMEPLDEEAQALFDARKPFWKHPIDDLPAQGGFSGAMLATFEKQLAEAMTRATAVPNTSVKGIDPAEFTKLQEQVAQLIARNAELETAAAKPSGRRL